MSYTDNKYYIRVANLYIFIWLPKTIIIIRDTYRIKTKLITIMSKLPVSGLRWLSLSIRQHLILINALSGQESLWFLNHSTGPIIDLLENGEVYWIMKHIPRFGEIQVGKRINKKDICFVLLNHFFSYILLICFIYIGK